MGNSNTKHTFDANKRKTIKTASGFVAAGILSSIPALGSTNSFDVQSPFHTDLEGTLVSIPNVIGETLILKNVTESKIQVNQFQANRVIFDGDVVDCNDACSGSTITIPANDSVLIRFKPQASSSKHSPAGEFLNLDKDLYRLPAGTRVVPLAARMQGNTAILFARADVA